MTAPPKTQALEALIEAHATELSSRPSSAASGSSPLRRPASNRHLSRTSLRYWKPRWPSGPNAASAGD